MLGLFLYSVISCYCTYLPLISAHPPTLFSTPTLCVLTVTLCVLYHHYFTLPTHTSYYYKLFSMFVSNHYSTAIYSYRCVFMMEMITFLEQFVCSFPYIQWHRKVLVLGGEGLCEDRAHMVGGPGAYPL